MKYVACNKFSLLWFLLVIVSTNLNAQTNTDSVTTKNKLIALRNDFIGRIEAMGYHPRLKYRLEIIIKEMWITHLLSGITTIQPITLHTSDWKTLPESEQRTIHQGREKIWIFR